MCYINLHFTLLYLLYLQRRASQQISHTNIQTNRQAQLQASGMSMTQIRQALFSASLLTYLHIHFL